MKDLDTMTYIELHISNFDHTIDEGCEEALRAKPGEVYCQHAAWNFCGYVWFEDGKFYEQVWRYHSPIQELSADTLEDLMELVNSEYGYD